MYLDIIITGNEIEVLDEDELDVAVENKLIDKETYDMAINVKTRLLDEIKNNSNKYLNLPIKRFLSKI